MSTQNTYMKNNQQLYNIQLLIYVANPICHKVYNHSLNVLYLLSNSRVGQKEPWQLKI